MQLGRRVLRLGLIGHQPGGCGQGRVHALDAVGQLVPLAQQPLWTEDWLGLKQLSEAGKLEFKEIEGEHMQFSLDWFRENIVEPYLR